MRVSDYIPNWSHDDDYKRHLHDGYHICPVCDNNRCNALASAALPDEIQCYFLVEDERRIITKQNVNEVEILLHDGSSVEIKTKDTISTYKFEKKNLVAYMSRERFSGVIIDLLNQTSEEETKKSIETIKKVFSK